MRQHDKSPDSLSARKFPALFHVACAWLALCCLLPQSAFAAKHHHHGETRLSGPPILWREPPPTASMDLLYGQSGRGGLPVPPFTFLEEDHNGTSPKFDVRDGEGRKWRVKLGAEARPEVVSSRLLWAAGYIVNDDFVLQSASVRGLHISRGKHLVHGDRVENARISRRPGGEKKAGDWQWKHNPFVGTREFNGLRVMMALINNWDLKDVNNAVYRNKETGRLEYLVSDVGATFGRNGLSFTGDRSKDNIQAYADSHFIDKVKGSTVDFGTPKGSPSILIESFGFAAPRFVEREKMQWIGRDIPRADARWIGDILGRLSHRQIVDAFRAGDYPPLEADAFARIVESRITQLRRL